ncbi:hypothetical protein ACROYT_G022582 [Oculina patagonica]
MARRTASRNGGRQKAGQGAHERITSSPTSPVAVQVHLQHPPESGPAKRTTTNGSDETENANRWAIIDREEQRSTKGREKEASTNEMARRGPGKASASNQIHFGHGSRTRNRNKHDSNKSKKPRSADKSKTQTSAQSTAKKAQKTDPKKEGEENAKNPRKEGNRNRKRREGQGQGQREGRKGTWASGSTSGKEKKEKKENPERRAQATGHTIEHETAQRARSNKCHTVREKSSEKGTTRHESGGERENGTIENENGGDEHRQTHRLRGIVPKPKYARRKEKKEKTPEKNNSELPKGEMRDSRDRSAAQFRRSGGIRQQ